MTEAKLVKRIMVEYFHSNSGGRDWLTEKDWKALHAAGWTLHSLDGVDLTPMMAWKEDHYYQAQKPFISLEAGVAEWKALTDQDPSTKGCSCCGRPHSFWADEEVWD